MAIEAHEFDMAYVERDVAMAERVVVAPATGRFHPFPAEVFTTEGEWVEPGQALGVVRTGKEDVEVVCPFRGWLMGMVALAGQPVRRHDALFWVRS
ncbi:MAG: hypothetical protein ACR2KQ_02975 [Actinomycetota bacterium]